MLPLFSTSVRSIHFRLALLGFALLFLSGCASLSDSAVNFNPFHQPKGPAKIVIDLSQQKAWLYRGGELAAVARISSGREGFDTPTGSFSVIEKDADHRSSVYGAYVLAGTRKIVQADVDTRKTRPPAGTTYMGAPMPWFLRFEGAHGLHAGEVPDYPASHGCIRLPRSAARKFFEGVKLGTPVIVQR